MCVSTYICMSVCCLYVYTSGCLGRTRWSIMVVRTFKHNGGFTSKEPKWSFYVNFVSQKNSFVQLLITLCPFQLLLRDLRQTSKRREIGSCTWFMDVKLSLPLAQVLAFSTEHQRKTWLVCNKTYWRIDNVLHKSNLLHMSKQVKRWRYTACSGWCVRASWQ